MVSCTVYNYNIIGGNDGSYAALSNITFDENANGYRLPNSKEWLYACKGTSVGPLYWGYDLDLTSIYECDIDWKSTYSISEVASKQCNQFGLYDMLGNASEFVSNDTSVIKGARIGWDCSDNIYNDKDIPYYGGDISRSNTKGFRCVRNP